MILEHQGQDGSTYSTLYAHGNGNSMPSVGSTVSAGQTIGQVGNTGGDYYPHLHFETISGSAANNGVRTKYPGGFKNRPAFDPASMTPDKWPATGPYWNGATPEKVGPRVNLHSGGEDDLIDENGVLDDGRACYNTAKVTSPLVFDLDGDGVETIAYRTGAYFDHDNNGFAETTGWAGADDGLLVWDRNLNGVIDGGHELFGNGTLLTNGQLAADGSKH